MSFQTFVDDINAGDTGIMAYKRDFEQVADLFYKDIDIGVATDDSVFGFMVRINKTYLPLFNKIKIRSPHVTIAVNGSDLYD